MQDDFDKDFYSNANKADILALVVAFIATVITHVGTYYVIPQEFSKFGDKQEKTDDLKIEVLPPKFEKKMPEFIEANPYANDNLPSSKDAPESFKNQRAADEIPDPSSKSKKPFVDGEIKDGKKIVSGTSSEQDDLNPHKVIQTLERPLQQPAQPTETSAQQTETATQATQETSKADTNAEQVAKTENANDKKSDSQAQKDTALTKAELKKESASQDENAFIKIEKKKETNLPVAKEVGAYTKAQKNVANTDKLAETVKPQTKQQEQKKVEQKQEAPQEENIPAPRPRPTLSMKIPAGPLADNRSHASAQGTVACDSRFSEFGAYQQRMLEAISRQWNLLASKYDLGTAVGTIVVIEFYLNTLGELSKFKILHTTSTNTGTGLCEQCILTTAPYGEWTQEMVNTFGGQDQSVRITFHYR